MSSAAAKAGVVNNKKPKQKDVDINVEKDKSTEPIEIVLVGVIWNCNRNIDTNHALTKKRLRFSDELIIVECDSCIILYSVNDNEKIKNGVKIVFEVYTQLFKKWEVIIPESFYPSFLTEFFDNSIRRNIMALTPYEASTNKYSYYKYDTALQSVIRSLKIIIDTYKSNPDKYPALNTLTLSHYFRSYLREYNKVCNEGL